MCGPPPLHLDEKTTRRGRRRQSESERERERESHIKAIRIGDTFQSNIVAGGAFKFVFEWLEMKPADAFWRDS